MTTFGFLRPAIQRSIPIALAVVCFGPGRGWAQEQKLVEMRELGARELRAEAFVLEAPSELRLRVTGAEPGGLVRFHRTRTAVVRFVRDVLDIPIHHEDGPWVANAWILDSRARTVVWELASAETKASDSGLRVFDGTVRLPAGTYEIYYATHQPHRNGWEYDREASGRLALQVLGANARFRQVTPESARREFDNGVVVALGRESGANAERIGFAVDRPTDVEVRLLETAAARAGRERAWIMDLGNRRVLWSFDGTASNRAEMNPRAEAEAQTISLPAGRYAAFHVRTTSHSGGHETTAHDPALAGLTLHTQDPASRSAVHTFTYEPVTPANVIVSLTRLGNDQARSAGFTLKKPLDVQIFALGESSSGRLVDWGQIVEARTRHPVWTMKFEDTRIAGGATKNRMFDGTTRLDAGDYVVSFVTDDSHAYDSWNATEPLDADFWGITVASVEALDRSGISPYDEANDPAILVRLTGVGDGQQLRRRFTLRNEANIRIYAIGEGDSDTMYDYARIVDASGKTVWQMHYGNSEPAGGAKKNRLFNGTVRLPAGDYEAIYQTDDSHSFASWNSNPPTDPRNWGVTIYR